MNSRYCILLLSSAVLLTGCSLFRDDRPEPSGSPYGGNSESVRQRYSEAEAVNAAVSAVSLKMAVSAQGPFRVVPNEKKITGLGFKTIESLTRMGLSRMQAPCPLYLEDSLNANHEWALVLLDASGKTFYRKSFVLRRK